MWRQLQSVLRLDGLTFERKPAILGGEFPFRQFERMDGMMLFFGKAKPKGEASYELSYMLTAKDIAKKEKAFFSGEILSEQLQRELCLAAPMLAKNEEPVDRFPSYTGKKAQKLQASFTQIYGELTEENIIRQAQELLEGSDEACEALYRITLEPNISSWSGLAMRVNGISSQQGDRLRDITQFYDRMGMYEMPLPPSLLGYRMARCANLLCIGVGLGAVAQEKAHPLLQQCLQRVAGTYKDWTEYLSGYALGRVFWLFCEGRYMAIGSTADLNICRVLLHAVQSPFRRLPLRTDEPAE